ncbi:MAG: ion channel [Candidatus Electrothrix aestuarii]|uniref:Ion channel n=1 Tax=Candidatus Electrothrix aestuarii TaxID=3062594 RepID=A0AAU8LWS8_9BACT|nr:ion channel [Candidatus Electrothrix aestuarii]
MINYSNITRYIEVVSQFLVINYNDIAKYIELVSPFLVAGCIVIWWEINHLSWTAPKKKTRKDSWLLIALLAGWIFLSIPLCYLIGYTLYHQGSTIHYYNVLGIIITLFLLSGIRIWLESTEELGEGRAPKVKAVFNFSRTSILLVSAYTATTTSMPMYRSAAWIIACFLIVVVVKYRIYDDIWKYALYTSSSKRYISSHPSHTVLRGLLDHIPRAYLYASYAFTIAGLLLIGPVTVNGGGIQPGAAFNMSNMCNNTFVDFFYFNIVTMSTVGYGDISPISITAKMICSFEIIFGVVVLATVLSLMIGRVQDIATQKAQEHRDNTTNITTR